MHRLPGPIPGRHIAPPSTRAHPPTDPINQLPLPPHRRPAQPRRLRQHQSQRSPLRITQIPATHAKIIPVLNHTEINFLKQALVRGCRPGGALAPIWQLGAIPGWRRS
jgi:hypothetical protein